MNTYLQFINNSHLKGNVSASGHNHWIAIATTYISIHRQIFMRENTSNSRHIGLPHFSELTINKRLDPASIGLMQAAASGKALGQAKVHFCRTDQELTPYLEYTLDNVIIGSYQNSSSPEGFPLEEVTLHFTRFEMRHTPTDKQNQSGSPLSTAYNLETSSLS